MNTIVSQALATGTPVVASRHGGLPEQVIDGWNGSLFPEGDIDALTDAIEKLMRHPETWPELGRNGRKHVRNHYNASIRIENQIADYRMLQRRDSRSAP